MGGKARTKEELRNIVQTILEVPQKENETQRAWLERLSVKYGLKRSRPFLQCVLKAMENAGTEDVDKIDEEMEKINTKRKEKQGKGQTDMAQDAENQKPEELQGQIRMEIEDPEEERKEMSEQTKMMRFQALEVDKIMKQMNDDAVMISTKLDKLNDTLSKIVRVFGP